MTTHSQQITRVNTPSDSTVERHEVQDAYPAEPATTETTERTTTASRSSVAVNIIWYITGLLEILLAFRFFLALFGANPANGFANFIYSVSHPFVAPFFGLFNYNSTYTSGVSRFEGYTLVAMAVYAVLAWLITKAFTLNRPRD